ncbi:dipeptidyl peptidase 4-like [Daktulosphaira vitifoliae]|uniref:dipeptidyl peptidase 4-like n=1 Tax=Daktulosphaira vitifoliae TaxID=58002 RepID=UPI0021AA7EEC|nr:dipeptidyl peptidase 4-like [Daktulosphaira vitifoliae]
MTMADTGVTTMTSADFDDQDLVGISNAQKRNWRGILIALMVIVAVLAMIIMSVVLLTPEEDFGLGGRWRRMRGRRIRLSDVLEDEQSHSVQLFNGTWISGHEMIYKTTEGGVGLLNVRTMVSTPLMSNHSFNLLNPVVDFTMSLDRKYLLIAHDPQKLFRYSYLARYTVYTISTNHMISVTLNTVENNNDNVTTNQQQQSYFMQVQWNGGAKTEDASFNTASYDEKITPPPEDKDFDSNSKPLSPLGLVAVYSNCDIYYIAILTEKLSENNEDITVKLVPKRITNTGVPGIISNGVPDWLYEEEILKSRTAMWTSSPNTPKMMMLYATFDDTRVGEYKFPIYSTNVGSDSFKRHLYPEIRSLRYPKAGTLNPIVTLSVFNIGDVAENLKNNNLQQSIKIRTLTPPSMFQYTDDYYFTSVQWVSPEEVCVVWLNRQQNTSATTICKSPMWICQETQVINAASMVSRHGNIGHGIHGQPIAGQNSQTRLGGWVDVTGPPVFSRDGDGYVSLAPIRYGTNSGSGRTSGFAGMHQAASSNNRYDLGAGYYRQIVAVNITKKLLIPLTYGPWTVEKILSWDHITNTIYFLAIPADRPSERHLYATTHYYYHMSSLSTSSSYRSHQPHTPAHLIDPQPSVCLSCSNEEINENPVAPDAVSTVEKNYTTTETLTITTSEPKPAESRLYQFLLSSQQYQLDQSEIGHIGVSKNAKQDKYDDQADQRKRHNQRLRENEQQLKTNRDPRRKPGGNQIRCNYYDAEFSLTAEFYALICLGPGVPMVTLHKTVVVPIREEEKKTEIEKETDKKKDDISGIKGRPSQLKSHAKISNKFVGTLENNTYLFDKYNTKVYLTATRTFDVRVSGGHSARIRLYLPPGVRFDSDLDSIGSGGAGASPDDDRKYPLIVHVGNGPGTQSVVDTWQSDWSIQYLAAAHDYVVAVVDGGRGSGGRGYDLLLSIYKRLGNYDVADQLEVTEYLRDNLHFVDKRRVAVWGSAGYGGYLAAKLLLTTMIQEKKRGRRNSGNGGGSYLPLFRCGIAIAPVCSWNLYTSFYSERHLGMPDENAKEYHDSDLVTDVQRLLEVHKEEESRRSPPVFYGQRHSSGRYNKDGGYYSSSYTSTSAQSEAPPYQYPEFYLVHGTADNKVHVQHTMRLTSALTRAADGLLRFKQQMYPDEDHDLAGVRSHFYAGTSDFLEQCFSNKDGEEEDDEDGGGNDRFTYRDRDIHYNQNGRD